MDLPVEGKVNPHETEEQSMRIGAIAEAAGTTAKTLRFYEEQGLLFPPERTAAGYRDYSPRTVDRIDFIHRGKAAGLTLAQIRQILDLRERGEAPCNHVRDLLDSRLAEIARQLDELAQLRDSLVELRAQAESLEPDTCGPDQVCRYL